jgi:hypothetical protein
MSKSLKKQVWDNQFYKVYVQVLNQVEDRVFRFVIRFGWNMVVDRVSAQVYNQVRKVRDHE